MGEDGRFEAVGFHAGFVFRRGEIFFFQAASKNW